MEKPFQYTALTGIFIYAVFCSTSIAISQGGIILALLGWAGKCVVSRRLLFPDSRLNIPVFLFLGLCLLAALLGVNIPNSMDHLRGYTFVMLMFLIPVIVPERKFQYLFWCFLLLAGAGGCIYFFVRSALAGRIWKAVTMGESGRMVPLFGAALGLAVCDNRWSRRIPLLTIIGLLLVGTVTNLERGPWLGVIAAAIVVGWFRSKKLLLVLLVVVAMCAVIPQVRSRALHTVKQLEKPERASRLRMWSAAPALISQYPYGVGQDNTGDIQKMRTGISSHFHNNFVTIAIESGIFALIAWTWWMVVFIKLAYDTWKKLPDEDRFEKGVCLGALAATVGFLAAGLFEYNYGDSEIAMMMYFLMGCVLVVWQGARLPVESREDRMAQVTC